MESSNVTLIAGGISLALGIFFVVWYRRANRLLAEMWAVDTYDSQELRRMCSGGFDAVVEVQGTVTCDKPLTSLAGKLPCCWHQTRVDREERRTQVTRTGIRTYYVWQTDFDRTFSTIFKVNDGTGYTLVDPTNAEIDTEEPFHMITDEREPWFDSVGHSDTGKYRITEEFFLPTGYVYVLGQASGCGEGASPDALIHYPTHGYVDPSAGFFVISRKSEKELAQSSSLSVRICLWGAVIAFGLTIYCALSALGVVP